MKPSRVDPALYYLLYNGIIRKLSGGYVDDIIRPGDKHFKKLSNKTNDIFEMGEDEHIPCEFTGFSLNYDNDGYIIKEQHSYLRKLESLPPDASFNQFRSMRMKFAWLSHSRPDCLFEISQLAQVTEAKFDSSKREFLKRLNRAVKFADDHRVSLKIRKLDKESLRIIGFSDASFANNDDLTSQLGHIVFLGDKNIHFVPLTFKSYKARRVTRSVMTGEVIAFSDIFDIAATISQELGILLQKRIPVELLTDSESLFDVVSKGSRMSEKCLMLDIAAAREGFRDKVISDIGFVRSSKNVADGLTKAMSQAMLQTVIVTRRLDIQPEQWIIRRTRSITSIT